MYVVGLAMQIMGVVLWSIDNVYCSQLEVLRATMHVSLAPFTQLHGWWHVLAGYSSYMHIIYCLHHRQIFLKQNSKLTIQPWIGITIETDPVAQNGDKKLLQSHKNSTTENVKDK